MSPTAISVRIIAILSYFYGSKDTLLALKIIMVNETDKGYVSDGEYEFTKRIGRFVPLEKIIIKANKKWNNLSPTDRKQQEGEKILEQIQPNDTLILLDERGKQYSSIDFSKKIEELLSYGAGNLVFCIGGAYGFSSDVYQRANQKLSLSKMTFSHQLIRVIFLEQVYRAFTIIHGHPYHNE